jgi:hypothetical protein
MTPRNYFDKYTAPCVAELVFAVGTTAFGYGETRETALVDVASSRSIFGDVAEEIVWSRTTETAFHGRGKNRYEYQIYSRA